MILSVLEMRRLVLKIVYDHFDQHPKWQVLIPFLIYLGVSS